MKNGHLSFWSGNNDIANKIVHEAALLFCEHGYEGTPISQICEAVGLSKGGLSYYFQAKEEILFNIHDVFINYELECANGILKKNLPPIERLRELIKTLVGSIFKYKPYCTVFFQSKNALSEDNLQKVKIKREEYHEIFHSCLRDGMEEGVFDKSIDIDVMTLAIFGMCNWTLYWIDSDGRLSADEISEIFFKMLLDGIKKK